MAESLFRLRIRFAKTGRLAYLSHLELTRALERLVRRSGLAFAVTQGFSAHMRHAPGPALPVGTRGLGELFDVWLTDYLRPEQALTLLRCVAPRGLEVRDAFFVSPKAKGLAATHVLETYELLVRLPEGGAAALEQGLTRLLTAGELTVERKGKPKTYDLRTAVFCAPEIAACEGAGTGGDAGEGTGESMGANGWYCVTLTLRASEQGSIRPEVLLRAAMDEGALEVAAGGAGAGEQANTAESKGALEIRSITRLSLDELPSEEG